MKSRYKAFEDDGIYFVTSSIIEWIPLFKSPNYYEILIKALSYRQKNGKMKLYAYVLMTNHFHLILSVDNISKFMKELKSYTAHEIINLLKKHEEFSLLEQLESNKKSHKTSSRYQIWQEGFHPQQILSEEMLLQKIEYIHQNPVRAGIVNNPEDWKYSSSSNYSKDEGILRIDPLI